MDNKLTYQSGWGNTFESESISGALPVHQNNPQKVAHGLYAEQLSGSSFTSYPKDNYRIWLYKKLPSVRSGNFSPALHRALNWDQLAKTFPPAPMRWDPFPYREKRQTFFESLTLMVGSGDPLEGKGGAAYVFTCQASMENVCFQSSDGEFLIAMQEGALRIQTEAGLIDIEQNEIAVIPRGMKWRVLLKNTEARGYAFENFGLPFEIPYRGPIGANGLANERDFQYPVAFCEKEEKGFRLFNKFTGALWEGSTASNPFDVVAWHGNYLPYKYNLEHFNTMGSISYDHPDPSIFTVLTSPSLHPGVANLDFVIFPPRWLVANKTFRPPYFHRNIMSEFMGLLHGEYDAKSAKGFPPGGSSLHNRFVPHGPEKSVFERASSGELDPCYVDKTMAIMLESSLVFRPSQEALGAKELQKDYSKIWESLEINPH